MRVLILTKNFPPQSCGVGDYAFRMAEAMEARGDSVTALTEAAQGRRDARIPILEHSLSGWKDLKPVLRIIAEATPERMQLEYSGYAWGRWGVAWWLNTLLFRLRQRGIAVDIGLHETAIRMRQHPLQIPVALAQWLHMALFLAAADSVALNLRSRVGVMGSVFPWWRRKLRYRPNSSNIPVWPISEEERASLRQANGVEPGDAVIATFGMLHTAKRYEALVAAIPLMREKRVRLWMLGDVEKAAPGYVARLKTAAAGAGIGERVLWPGRMDACQVSRMLQAVDVFVLPQADGHLTRSGSFMAAAAHGLPVVAVRDRTRRDQAEFVHGKSICFVERAGPDEFAAAMDELLQDRAATSRLGAELRRLYAERFDWSATMCEPAVARQPAAGAATLESGGKAMRRAHASGVER